MSARIMDMPYHSAALPMAYHSAALPMAYPGAAASSSVADEYSVETSAVTMSQAERLVQKALSRKKM